jgi:hypothetical protein
VAFSTLQQENGSFRPHNFSHVIEAKNFFDGVKELNESVILSLCSMGLSTKTYV